MKRAGKQAEINLGTSAIRKAMDTAAKTRAGKLSAFLQQNPNTVALPPGYTAPKNAPGTGGGGIKAQPGRPGGVPDRKVKPQRGRPQR